jgi:hypothetical protein
MPESGVGFLLALSELPQTLEDVKDSETSNLICCPAGQTDKARWLSRNVGYAFTRLEMASLSSSEPASQ